MTLCVTSITMHQKWSWAAAWKIGCASLPASGTRSGEQVSQSTFPYSGRSTVSVFIQFNDSKMSVIPSSGISLFTQSVSNIFNSFPTLDVALYRAIRISNDSFINLFRSYFFFSISVFFSILQHFWMIKGSDAFGQGTITRSWDDGTESLDNYKRRLSAAFEFYSKLGS